MAYSKLHWLAYADQAVGLRTINQAMANLIEHVDVLTVRHGQVEPVSAFGIASVITPPRRFGNHNDVRIPRTMQLIQTASVVGASVGGVSFGRPTLSAGSQDVISRIERTAVGVYFAAITGLTSYFADPSPASTSSVVRRVTQVPMTSTQGADPGIVFVCQELDGSNVFQPADFDFSFAVYGAA